MKSQGSRDPNPRYALSSARATLLTRAPAFPTAPDTATSISSRQPTGSPAPTAATSASPPPQQPKPLDRLREALRSRHYSRRTEQCYCHRVRRFIFFHHDLHPRSESRRKRRSQSRGHVVITAWYYLRLMRCFMLVRIRGHDKIGLTTK